MTKNYARKKRKYVFRYMTSLSYLMSRVIEQMEKEGLMNWDTQFDRTRYVLVEPFGDGYRITAKEGKSIYIAKITETGKSYMIDGNEQLFQRLLRRKLAK